jgi:eukaryotic-like serine/threonine-protein kinase
MGQLLGGRYHVGSRIARGGMATVYLGTDTRLDRVVALKIAHPEVSDDAEFVRRFIGEARSAARLSSPNVVAVYDQASEGRLHYIAMEYVPGRTLRDLLTERGRLEPREALDIMTGVLAGLAAAHQAGFCHRDVKPENVLLTTSGVVKVADFGLARAMAGGAQTKGGMIIGTAGYLAPEQVSGGLSDARTDVYAAGIMLFELLTGRQPHTGASPLAVAYKHVNEVVPAPSSLLPGLSPALDALVAMTTSRDPELRPANAGQFQRAIEEVRKRIAAPPPDGLQPGAMQPGTGRTGQYQAAHRQQDSGPYSAPYGYDNQSDPGSYPGRAYTGPLGARQPGSAPVSSGPADYAGNSSWPFDSGQYESPQFESPQLESGSYDSGRRDGAHSSTTALEPQAVGASSLPSLRPQSDELDSGLPDPRLAMNHTLVVPAGAAFADYQQAPARLPGYQSGGYGDDPYDRMYRGHREPGRRSDPLLQRLLFGRRFWLILVAVVVIVAIGGASWWFSAGRYTKVPAMHGMAASAAKGVLHKAGLTARIGKPVHSPLPKGEVITTTPANGSRIADGGAVTLVLSLGPQMILVPDVTGQPLAQAEQALTHAHLRPGAVVRTVSGTVPVGNVISTTPPAYTSWPATKPVRISVSVGPGLPDFINQPLTTAQAAATTGGYTIQVVPDAKSNAPANTVTGQSPPPNTPIKPGEVVTVHVSQGPPVVNVPDVKGWPLREAIKAMQQAGFQVTVDQQGPGQGVGNYSPTTPQPQGSTITLDVGLFSGL